MSPSQGPDVIKAGEVMATLNDWRAITFVLVFVIVAMIAERALTSWSIRQDRARERKEQAEERDRMWEVADKFSDAAQTIGAGFDKVSLEMRVLRAVSSRIEAARDADG